MSLLVLQLVSQIIVWIVGSGIVINETVPYSCNLIDETSLSVILRNPNVVTLTDSANSTCDIDISKIIAKIKDGSYDVETTLLDNVTIPVLSHISNQFVKDTNSTTPQPPGVINVR